MSKCKITGKVLSVRLGRDETQLLLVGKNSDILYSASIPTPEGAVDDGMIRNTDAVKDMLKTALQVPELKHVRQVVFSLCTTQIISELANTPDLPAAKLEKLLQSNADMYFPVDTRDYQLVWEVLGPRGDGSTKEVEVQLWAVPIAMITRYYAVANACGLSVLAVDYCGHSMATAVGATFARPTKKAAKQAKQKKKLDLNAEISFGKKKKTDEEDRPEPKMEPVLETDAPETQLYLLLENDILGMTFVQNGQVMMQRFIRCGAQPSYQFGEMSMMLEYYRSMEIARGSEIKGFVAGELAKDRYILGDLEDMLGLRLFPLDTNYDPPWCLCYGAAHTTLDFGSQSLNSPAMSRGHMRSQLGQYVAILACGLVLLAVVMFTMTAKLGWDTELNALRTQQQTLMMTSNKYSGFADNYKEYQSKYSQYSEDWDLIFSSVQTYNDNMVLVLEELENLIPAKTDVTSMQMVSNALNVTFACSNKEEAAYLIMALREMEYADLIALSNLTGGGRGAADSYGDPDYVGYYTPTEKPPVEGGATLDQTVTVEAVIDPTQVPETTRDPNEESDEFIMNMIGFLGSMFLGGEETPAPTEAPSQATVPGESTGGDVSEDDAFLMNLMGYLENYFNNGTSGIPYFDIIIEEQISKFLRTGATDYPQVDAYIGTAVSSGALDGKLDELLNKYIVNGTCGNDAADETFEKFLRDKTTGVAVVDTALENFVWAGKADEEITILYARYLKDGKTGIPAIDALVEEVKANGNTGIPKLDVKITECISKYDPNKVPTQPDSGNSGESALPQAGIITQESFLASLQKYMSEGTTGIEVLDKMIYSYLNPPQPSSDSGNKTSSSGGTQVTDTRVFFSAVLGYNNALRFAELERKGLSYTDKLVNPFVEVTE